LAKIEVGIFNGNNQRSSFFITPDGSTKTKNTAVQNEKYTQVHCTEEKLKEKQ